MLWGRVVPSLPHVLLETRGSLRVQDLPGNERVLAATAPSVVERAKLVPFTPFHAATVCHRIPWLLLWFNHIALLCLQHCFQSVQAVFVQFMVQQMCTQHKLVYACLIAIECVITHNGVLSGPAHPLCLGTVSVRIRLPYCLPFRAVAGCGCRQALVLSLGVSALCGCELVPGIRASLVLNWCTF